MFDLKTIMFQPLLGMFQHCKCGLGPPSHLARGKCRGVIWNRLLLQINIFNGLHLPLSPKRFLNAIFSRKLCCLQFSSRNGNAQINRVCYVNRRSDFFVFFMFWLGGGGGGRDRKCVIKCGLGPLCFQFPVWVRPASLWNLSVSALSTHGDWDTNVTDTRGPFIKW